MNGKMATLYLYNLSNIDLNLAAVVIVNCQYPSQYMGSLKIKLEVLICFIKIRYLHNFHF